MSRFMLFVAVLLITADFDQARSSPADDFALRDGDTVVFLGDSLTAARTYGKYIENYTLLRYPDRKIRFINSGKGGDTADGSLQRIERDVFAHKPTVLFVMFGTNDIGWGVYADDEHKQKYLSAIRTIVLACKERNVRVYVCSEPVTAADPHKSEESFLQKMCDEGMTLSKSLGGEAIDVQRSMREIQKRVWAANEPIKEESKKNTMHLADGTHLNDLGQLAVAFAMLKGLGAPAEVSSAKLDYADEKLIETKGCAVSDVVRNGERLEFTRLDAGLPFNHGIFFAFHFRFVPVLTELNRYMICVKNLPKGRYDITVEGRGVATLSSEQLSAGFNVASSTANGWEPGGPWNAQADVLVSLTNARHELATANVLATTYLKTSDLPELLVQKSAVTNEHLEATQRLIARPKPYRFAIEPAREKSEK
ncbi:MAG: SGNH/GDSL hydrolase family protein [Planctomycetia bacterium]|nr:SGNH/GDSL hydrolase family protein [Planctomycetia bacterium]